MNRYKHILNEWYMDNDRYNYILVKRSIVKEGKRKGEEKFTNESFYPNLPSLKRGILNKIILEDFINVELTELLNNIDKIILKMEAIK